MTQQEVLDEVRNNFEGSDWTVAELNVLSRSDFNLLFLLVCNQTESGGFLL